ncbi:hypothetical protein FB45DRAFT_1017900 [Roridomyces roridus]|uniref:Uncharacterized protein n=1 Tax=Roridomyces roridus TaxID=1738132 RepID=A0AAD7CJH2_9AGAR|nr:hypothetical protein FB45DRAFT_1017900 [Roridomyces roridus]
MDLSQPPDEAFSELASQTTRPAISAEQPHGELKPTSESRDIACAVAADRDKFDFSSIDFDKTLVLWQSRVERELLPKAPPRAPTHPRPRLRAGRVSYDDEENDVESWHLWDLYISSN